MNKITDNEIIKGLECCINCDCKNCPFYEESMKTCKDGEVDTELVLDLINRLKTNDEKNENVIRLADKTIEKQSKEIEEQQAEIERLKGSNSTGLKEIESTLNEFWDGLEKLSMYKGKDKPTLEELLEYIEQKDEEIRRLQKTKIDILSAWEYRAKQVKEFAYKEFAKELKERVRHQCSMDFEDVDNLLAELTPTLNMLPHSSLCETETYESVTDTNVGGKKKDLKTILQHLPIMEI